MEYVILIQSVSAEDGNHVEAMQEMAADVNLYLQDDWQPLGGPSCGQVNGRFFVAQAMVREREAWPEEGPPVDRRDELRMIERYALLATALLVL